MTRLLDNLSDSVLRWSKADLHIHTRLSDGGPSPVQVVEHVLRHTDLAVIAITDHNRMDGGLRVRSLAADYGLEVIVGEEVGTADGHLLALFIEEAIAPGRPMEETVAEVHAQGGLAIVAHPYDIISSSLMGRGGRRRGEEALANLPVDGVEVLNGSLVRHMANVRATYTARRLGLTMVGGSDAHHLAVIGQAHTLFPGRTAEDLRQAIRAGTTQAGGQSWRIRQYLSWISGCFIPRTVRRARGAVRAYGQ